MLSSLNTAVSGMQQFQGQINVIGNNIANVNTAGYKNARANFEDAFNQSLGSGSQVGSGVATSSIQSLFTQGTVSNTGLSSDMAISGEGFFVVRDANAATATTYATRAGNFQVDAGGFLTTKSGLRLQGYNDNALSTQGDILLDATGAPATAAAGATFKSFSVDESGKINVTLSDGTTFVRGQVLLQSYRNPNALIKQGGNLYAVPRGGGRFGGFGGSSNLRFGEDRGQRPGNGQRRSDHRDVFPDYRATRLPG